MVLAVLGHKFQNQCAVQNSATPLPESLSGLIERVTFYDEDAGFGVLKVKAQGHRDLVTVVGSLPSVSAGEWLTAQGRWVQDREYGQQFRAELLTSTPPTSKEGIEKYLGSGMVKGIGPVYAKKLVDRFGEGVFDIIEKASARLEEVDGIGPTRRKRIKVAWDEQKVVRDIMLFLHSNGVSTSRAVRIYRTYGEGAIEKVRNEAGRGAGARAAALRTRGKGLSQTIRDAGTERSGRASRGSGSAAAPKWSGWKRLELAESGPKGLGPRHENAFRG